MKIVVYVILLVFIIWNNAYSEIRYVGNCGTPNYSTIQNAIDSSNDGDTIKLCAGTFTGDVNVNKQGLTIESVDTSNRSTIKGTVTISNPGTTTIQNLRIEILSGYCLKDNNSASNGRLFIRNVDVNVTNSGYGIDFSYLSELDINNYSSDTRGGFGLAFRGNKIILKNAKITSSNGTAVAIWNSQYVNFEYFEIEANNAQGLMSFNLGGDYIIKNGKITAYKQALEAYSSSASAYFIIDNITLDSRSSHLGISLTNSNARAEIGHNGKICILGSGIGIKVYSSTTTNNISIRNVSISGQGTGNNYGIQFDHNAAVTVTNSCFMSNNKNFYVSRKNSNQTFNGNFWKGGIPTDSYGVLDNNPLSSCPISCGETPTVQSVIGETKNEGTDIDEITGIPKIQNFIFTVNLDNPATTNVRLMYEVITTGTNPATIGNELNGCNDGVDVLGTSSGFAVIPRNSSSVQIPVSVCMDNQIENNETFALRVISATNANVPTGGVVGVATIVNDDYKLELDYRMDECFWLNNSPSVKDSSGNNRNAISFSNANTIANGVINREAKFNRSDSSFIQLNNIPYSIFSSGFTATAWVTFDGPNGKWERIFDAGRKNDDANILWAREETSNNLALHILAPNTGQRKDCVRAKSLNAIVNGERAFFAVVVDSTGNVRMFKNGIELPVSYDTSANMTNCGGSLTNTMMNVPRTLLIGRSHWSGDSYTNGKIDEFKIFAGVLSPEKIQSIYQNEKQGKNWDGSVRNPVGLNNGLLATYFNFPSGLSIPPTELTGDNITRIEQGIFYDWGQSAPSNGFSNSDRFGVRWIGYFVPPSSGNYKFRTRSDDGVRLWLNNQLIINNWTLHSPTYDISQPVYLNQNQLYDFRVDFFENTGYAVIQVEYSINDGEWQILQNSQSNTILKFCDNSPPDIQTIVTHCGNTNAYVVFNEPVSQTSASSPNHFTIKLGTSQIPVSSVNIVSDDMRLITFSQPLLPSTNYTLTVNQLQDMATPSNIIYNVSKSFVTDTVGQLQQGLNVTYWNNTSLTGQPVLETFITYLNDNRSNGSPAPGVNSDKFSARYKGYLKPNVTGLHKIRTYSDDGIRLKINGRIIQDDWTDHSTREITSEINLIENILYPIEIEFYENQGVYSIILQWQPPGSSSYSLITGDNLQRCAPVTNNLTYLYLTWSEPALTCQPLQVTIKACMDNGSDCSQPYTGGVSNIQLSATDGATWSPNSSVNIPSGSDNVTTNLIKTTAGTTSISATSASPMPSNNPIFKCQGGNCNIDFKDGVLTLIDYNGQSLNSVKVPNQISYKPFSQYGYTNNVPYDNVTPTLRVPTNKPDPDNSGITQYAFRSVIRDDTTGACVSNLNGQKAVTFKYNYVCGSGYNAPYCANPLPDRLFFVNTSPIARNGSTVNLTFTNGISSPFQLRLNDAGIINFSASTNVTVDNQTKTLSYTSDNFTVRPLGYIVDSWNSGDCSNSPNANCPKSLKVGEGISLNISPVGWQSANDTNYFDNPNTLPNFRTAPQNCPTVTDWISVNAIWSGVDNKTLDNMTLVPNTTDACYSSTATLEDAKISNVGVYRFVATTSDWYYAGEITSFPLGADPFDNKHYGSKPLGRFVPDHFTLDQKSVERVCNSDFVYLDKPFKVKYELTARGIDGSDNLKNYTAQYGKGVVSLGADNTTQNITNLVSGHYQSSWIEGKYIFEDNLTVTKPNPATSFEKFRLGLKVDDPDGAYIKNPDMSLGQPSCSSCDYKILDNSTRALYGILNIKNAYGSVNFNLDVPAYLIYLDNTSKWTINTNDSCTDITTSLFALSDYIGNLNPGETSILFAQKKSNGVYEIRLKAPGNGNDGSVKLKLTGLDFLKNTDTKYPLSEGVATFGIYGNHNKRLYWKEVPAR